MNRALLETLQKETAQSYSSEAAVVVAPYSRSRIEMNTLTTLRRLGQPIPTRRETKGQKQTRQRKHISDRGRKRRIPRHCDAAAQTAARLSCSRWPPSLKRGPCGKRDKNKSARWQCMMTACPVSPRSRLGSKG